MSRAAARNRRGFQCTTSISCFVQWVEARDYSRVSPPLC